MPDQTTKQSRRRTGGRPAGPSTARQDIIDAAIHLFADGGYDHTSLRSITDRAGVDVALVKHYFGSKQGLFDEAVLQHADRSFALRDLLTDTGPDIDARARQAAEVYLSIWETDPGAATVRALFRAALESEEHRASLERVLTEKLDELAPGISDAPRMQLLAAHLMGVGVMRYLLKFSPVADLSHEAMVDDLAPLIKNYLR
ncbi:TetR/AcrR family transcriptional regulator [Corynebacterium variabile]|uniref:TetR/AcrR family transcriptional regulator n=1 Tax=Corynebacterium variabile TaxID=1727 RepID=UPI003F93C876